MRRRLKQYHLKVHFTNTERYFFLVLLQIKPHLKSLIRLVQPETVLYHWKKRLSAHWSYLWKNKPVGRPPLTAEIRQLILRIKKENPFFGNLRIAGILKQLNIQV